MDRETVEAYERLAHVYAARPSTARSRSLAAAARGFAGLLPPGAVRVDLGCGPGTHTGLLGAPVVAVDAARAMVALAVERAPAALGVVADAEALPLRSGSTGAAWASKSLQHLPHERLPRALAELHRCLGVGSPVELVLFPGEGTTVTDDDLPGRRFSWWGPGDLRRLLTGAGFDDVAVAEVDGRLHVRAHRARSLPDAVGTGMRLLVCGLNPSLYAADAGVPFARPGNRFWPAALEAGLATRDRDPWHALATHGVGTTDLVKRATPSAAELGTGELAAGADRVRWLVEWLRPGAVCFVGLQGYRGVVDRTAVAGWQREPFGGRPAYVMPSTSGRNAHAGPGDFVAHLRAAADGADGRVTPPGGA